MMQLSLFHRLIMLPVIVMPSASNQVWYSYMIMLLPVAREFQVVCITTVNGWEKATKVIWCLDHDKLQQALSCNLVNSIRYRLDLFPEHFYEI